MLCRVCRTFYVPSDAFSPLCDVCRPLAILTSHAPCLTQDDPRRRQLAISLALACEMLEVTPKPSQPGPPWLAIRDAAAPPATTVAQDAPVIGNLPDPDLLAVSLPGLPVPTTPPAMGAQAAPSHDLFHDPITHSPRPKAKRLKTCPFPGKLLLQPPPVCPRAPKPAGPTGKWHPRILKTPPVGAPPKVALQ